MTNQVTIILEEDSETGYFLNMVKQYGKNVLKHKLLGSQIVGIKIEACDNGGIPIDN